MIPPLLLSSQQQQQQQQTTADNNSAGSGEATIERDGIFFWENWAFFLQGGIGVHF
jgi:hypothetical protein